jgi:hypothetical protein
VLHVLAARRRALPGLAAAVLLLGGCGDLDDSAAAQGITQSDLVSELAGQLTRSATLTYAAGYQLAGGGTATVSQAQNPARAAYAYPGGRVLVTEQAVTECRGTGRQTCTMTAPPDPGAAPPARVFAGAQRTGMVAPATVLALLNAAALDPTVTLKPRDTTIAGHHATCVELSGLDDDRARAFTTCVTNDGVLGSFTGTVDGETIDVAMTQFESRVRGDAFNPPPGATIVDRRKLRAR